MDDPEPVTHGPTTRRRVGPSAVLGAALALPALAVVVVGAGAARPPLSGDGAWTTPVQVLMGVAALGLLLALVLVVRNMPGVVPATRGDSKRSRWWLLAGAAAVGVLAWLSGVAAREPGDAELGSADFGLPAGLSGEGVAPLPATTTAVVAGLVALGLLAALAVVLLGRHVGTRPAPDDATAVDRPMSGAATDGLGEVPDGPPDEVVLAAWAAARLEVVGWLGAGEHDPPGGLLQRAAQTPAAGPLRRLTELYLPVRYGRERATAADAAAARTALEELRTRTSTIGAGR